MNVAVACIIGLGTVVGLLLLLTTRLSPVRAATGSDGVEAASGAVITVCLGGGCDFDSVQAAVDAAGDGYEVRVAAGTYTGVSARAGVTQVVYIDKSVTVRGGYTVTNWSEPRPMSHPTTLDAEGQGRVLFVAAGVTPTLEGLRIIGGRASQGGGATNGGGVYVADAAPTIKNCEIIGNRAQYGAGVYLRTSAADLRANTVASNTAEHEKSGLGGGAYVDGGTPSLTRNLFVGNRAPWGAGLFINRSNAMVSENTIVDNEAPVSGGGLYLLDSATKVSSNTIASNRAVEGAGVFINDGQDALLGNEVRANIASKNGGGIYTWQSGATLDANHVVANRAIYGGGMILRQGATRVSRNVIQENVATYGGGLYLDWSSDSLDANMVNGNVAYLGGGVYLLDCDAELTNMVVVGNQADIGGHDLRVWGGSPRLRHTTLVGREGAPEEDGPGVSVTDADLQLVNTILVRYGIGILLEENEAETTVSAEGTLWGVGPWANGKDWTGEGQLYRVGDVYGDPAFVDPGAGNYHLRVTSAAIDRGLETSVDTDVDGQPRTIPAGGRPDLGADECTGIDLSGSRKTAAPLHVGVGQVMTYTLKLVNRGHVSATNTLLSDEIPTATTYLSGSVLASDGEVADEGRITWRGTLMPQQAVTITFAVKVDREATVHNTAFVTDAYGVVTRLTAWSNGEMHFLPLVLRRY